MGRGRGVGGREGGRGGGREGGRRGREGGIIMDGRKGNGEHWQGREEKNVFH